MSGLAFCMSTLSVESTPAVSGSLSCAFGPPGLRDVTQLLLFEEDSFLNKKDKPVVRFISEQECQYMFCSQGGC